MTSPSKPAPQYNAYTPVIVHDGLTQHLTHHFDNTREMTPDDLHMAKAMLKSLSPSARIEAMQDRLGTLQNPTPEMALHISAIKEIHAVLTANGTSKSLTVAELDLLDKADGIWKKVLLLRDLIPVAKSAKKFEAKAARTEDLLRKLQTKNPT